MLKLVFVIAVLVPSIAYAQAGYWSGGNQLGSRRAYEAESNHNRFSPQEMADIERAQEADRPRKFVAVKGQQLTTQQRAYNRWFDKAYYIGRNGQPMLRRPGVPLKPPKVGLDKKLEARK